jgi:hypothetical protein
MMQIPLEKFNEFLEGLNSALTVARIAQSYNQAMGAKETVIHKPFVWIDDGKGEVRTKITFVAKEGEKA